jgi:hypothetical protein
MTYTAAPTGGSSTFKLVVALVAVVLIIGTLAVVTILFVASRVVQGSKLAQTDATVQVNTPAGTLNDPQAVVRNLGVDIYPGAQVQKKGAADLTIGPLRTITATFESADSPQKICDFYKSRILGSTVKATDQNHCSVVSKEPLHVVTITVEGGDTTKFQIACLTKPAD